MALVRKISTSLFELRKGKTDEYVLATKFFLPKEFLESVRKRTRKYHVYGTVYLEYPTYFTPLPGCRIDFYEVDPVVLSPRLSRFRRQDFLGSAYTNADGTYDFHFKFGWAPVKPGHHLVEEWEYSPDLPIETSRADLFHDYKPDIRARFYQYIGGSWKKIYDAPMMALDWNIDTEFHRDYRIPSEYATEVTGDITKPETGFRFKTIGLISIDTTRIVDGYAHSQPGDPLEGITHEPFCFTLRIYGLFAAAPVVATYTVEIMRTNADGTAATTVGPGGVPVAESWKPLGETLTNLEWNDAAKRWDSVTLGPTSGRYQNIDIQDPMAWLEPSLKATWNTANCPNGYYKLRITGYDASDTAVVTSEMPMIRTDNDPPDAALDVVSPGASICGDLTLGADRTITFQVTAHEPEGHLYGYYLWGTRGRYGESAGTDIVRERSVANDIWYGVIDEAEGFAVGARSASTIMCATMAYSFHLRVQGSGTNGYGHCFEHPQKRVYKRSIWWLRNDGTRVAGTDFPTPVP